VRILLDPLYLSHLAALALYLASCLYVILVLLPIAAATKDARAQRRLLARSFRILNPVAIGALGVVLMTGAFRLTDVKARLGPLFFREVGLPLAVKLALAFLVINVATYVAFGLGYRVVRAHQGDVAVDARWQRSVLVRTAFATCLAIGLTLATIHVSLRLGQTLRLGRTTGAPASSPAPARASSPHASPAAPDTAVVPGAQRSDRVPPPPH
jgi:hypothetical protein